MNARVGIQKDEDFNVYHLGYIWNDTFFPVISMYSLEDLGDMSGMITNYYIDELWEKDRNDGEFLAGNIKDFINSIE